MGNIQNNRQVSQGTLQTIDQEYQRVSKTKSIKKSLTLSEILEAKTPENHPFTFNHIGVLFVCDKELDSLFSRNDIIHFTLWIQENLCGVPSYEFKAELQTEALDALIHYILVPDNQKKVVDWMIGMLIKDTQLSQHENYIKLQQLKLLYDVLNVKTLNNMDYQYFRNLIIKSGEEMGYQVMEVVENDEMEEYIAVEVCQHFIKFFLKGVKKMVRDIGFDKPII